MKLHNIEVLVAEDQLEAKILATLAIERKWRQPWVKHIWRLTLPKGINANSLYHRISHLRDLTFPPPENNMPERMGL